MKKFLLLILCLLFIYEVSAQATWGPVYVDGGTDDDTPFDITVDKEGNFYVTGFYEGRATFGESTAVDSIKDREIFISKYDKNGDFKHVEVARGPGESLGKSIYVDESGNIYLTGDFGQTVDFDGEVVSSSDNRKDVFIAKYNKDFEKQWIRVKGKMNIDDNAYGITGDENGIYVIYGDDDAIEFELIKYDSEGKEIWSNTISGNNIQQKGIAVANGNIYLAGSFFNSTVTFQSENNTQTILSNNGGSTLYLAKYNSNGDVKIIAENKGTSDFFKAEQIVIDEDENIYVVGWFTGKITIKNHENDSLISNGNNDIFLAKFSSNGEGIWRRGFGGTQDDAGRDITYDRESIYITGMYKSDNITWGNGGRVSSNGDNDVFIARFDQQGNFKWAESLGGADSDIGTAIVAHNHLVYTTGFFSSKPAQYDNDKEISSVGQNDIFIAKLLDETPASTQKFVEKEPISTQADGAQSVFSIDLDGDEDADVLSASWHNDKIAWYENDGKGNFVEREAISTQADGARSVFAIDLDRDGDADVLSASYNDDKIAWYENLGGGNFGAQQVISTQADGATSVFAIDLDGDGDADVLSASEFDDKIAWYENVEGIFVEIEAISTQADGAISVFAIDLDRDGDADVLSASQYDDKIAWYENTDGKGTFVEKEAISTQADFARSVFAIDLDGDGDADVLSTSWHNDKIAWYENTDGKGTFVEKEAISTQADGARTLFAIDLDGDGDADVLSASENDDKIAWYENTDGKGTFVEKEAISTQADGAESVFAIDLDGDGDADVLSASSVDDKIAWYENRILGILSFSKESVIGGDELTIFGQNFAETVNNNLITLTNNGTLEGFSFIPDEFNKQELTFTIPDTIPYGSYTVMVASDTQSVTSSKGFYVQFQINDFEPKQGIPGDTIFLEGTNFHRNNSDQNVSIGEKLADHITTNLGTQIQITVPELDPGEFDIIVFAEGLYSRGVFEDTASTKFTVLSQAPTITAISPSGTVAPGTEITISGTNFDQADLIIKIGGQDVTPIDPPKSTEIKVTIPDGLDDREYQIIVTTDKGEASETISINTDDIAPELMLITNPDSYTSGPLTLTLEAIDEGSGIASVEFRSIGFAGKLEDVSWSAVTSSGENAFSVTLTASNFDEIGLHYQFRATDNAGNTDSTEVQTIIRQYGQNPVNIANAWSPASTSATIKDYQLIAIPFASQSVANVLEELGQQDETSWRLFQYWEDLSKTGNERAQFTEYPTSFSTFEPGKGYFFIYRNQGEISITGQLPTSIQANQSVTIPLQPGYNLIGNPYLFPIDWNRVIQHNASESIQDQLKVLNRGVGSNSTTLAPFKGAFVLNMDENNTVSIEIPVSAKNGRYAQDEKPKKLNPLHAEAWEVPLRVESDALSYHLSAIGMHPEADASADPLDDFTLPRFLEYLELNFYHPEFFMPKFSKDIVPTREAYTWEFEVASNLTTPEVTLSWDNHYFGTNDRELMLLDLHNYQIINMREATFYTFSVIAGKRTFKVYFGNEATTKANMLPESISVGEAYPNPMQNQFTIPVSLPDGNRSYDLQLEIFNITGQLVRRIQQIAIPPGYQTLRWDRQNQEGKTVSPGLYLYRVNIDNKTVLSNGRMVVQ